MRGRIVADASVLIFLGKIRQFSLLQRLWAGPFYISDFVRDEVLPPTLAGEERDYLTRELRLFKVASPRQRPRGAGALSQADWSVIHLAQQRHANLVLADERALRNVLAGLNFKTLGTLGILLAAKKKKLLSKGAAREYSDALITHHRFRISAETYKLFLELLDS